jgi:hypothetical protein
MDTQKPTPERILLAAIFRTLSPKKRQRVLDLIGETSADNVVRLRSLVSSQERNELVRGALKICGEL